MPSRYQREIEQILEQAGEPAPSASGAEPKRRSFRKLVWLYAKQSLSGRPLSISPGRIMLAGFVLLLSFLIVTPFLGLPGLLGWAGLVIFIIGYGMLLARPPRIEKRWRGELIEMDGSHDSWLNRIKRKFQKR